MSVKFGLPSTTSPSLIENEYLYDMAGDKAEAIDLVLERNGQTIGYASGMLTYACLRQIRILKNIRESD